ncbi:hypothetical protein ES703_32247 [subsurface metagenome]
MASKSSRFSRLNLSPDFFLPKDKNPVKSEDLKDRGMTRSTSLSASRFSLEKSMFSSMRTASFRAKILSISKLNGASESRPFFPSLAIKSFCFPESRA